MGRIKDVLQDRQEILEELKGSLQELQSHHEHCEAYWAAEAEYAKKRIHNFLNK